MAVVVPGVTVPGADDGFGLLWAFEDVALSHAGRDAHIRAGDLALIDRQLPFTLTAATTSGGARTMVAQLLDLGERSFAVRADRRADHVGKALDGDSPAAQMLKRLWAIGQEIDRLQLADDLVEARLLDLIAGLGGRLLWRATDGCGSYRGAALVERAELLIAANLSDPEFSVATLAASMRITPRHLSSLFAATGITTTQAILRQRLARARSLLVAPVNRHRQIAAIARECGFADQSYFARCFRHEEGMTAREYRAMHL